MATVDARRQKQDKIFPKMLTYQQQVIDKLPRDIWVLDTAPSDFNKLPGFEDQEAPLALFARNGHQVMQFLFHLDPEAGLERELTIFPRPLVNASKRELLFSKGIGVNGVTGYRMTPRARFLSDYAYARLAWNPELQEDDIIGEMAGFLSARRKPRASHQKGNRRSGTILLCPSGKLIDEAVDQLSTAGDGRDKRLRDLRDQARVLQSINALAFIDPKEKQLVNQQVAKCINQFRNARIYRGYTSSENWESRIRDAALTPRLNWWSDVLRKRMRRGTDVE